MQGPSKRLARLTTASLVLRQYAPSDVEAVHEFAHDPVHSQYQTWGPNALADTEHFVQRVITAAEKEPTKEFFWAITLKDNDRVIGGCNLVADSEPNTYMLGYTLHKKHWRKGYTTEAAKALMEYAFTKLSAHRVFSWAVEDNVGSWRVMEKIGMRREGVFKEAVFFKGQWWNKVIYAMLAREFNAKKP